MAKTLDAAPPFGPDDVEVLCELFESGRPDLRLAATRLLKGEYLDETARRRLARSLRHDAQTEVREAAIRALE